MAVSPLSVAQMRVAKRAGKKSSEIINLKN
jgi:hypothetical protein